jgi:hypothetical protein
MVMKFNLNVSLQFAGFKGEGIVDNRIWISKTHFPLRMPYDREYKSNIVLCCVRNPLDVFVSEFVQISSMTHNLSINENFSKDFEEWDWMIRHETKVWKKWHEYWIEKAQSNEVPVYFFRYEDLLSDPSEVLTGIFSFVFQ